MNRRGLLLTTVSLMLSACANSPLAERPEIILPEAWSIADLPAVDPETDRWWTAIGDPVLDGLMDQVGDNADVRLAEARLFEARARLGLARASLRPDAGVQLSADQQSAGDLDQETFQALVSLSIAPDLNGASRARIEADALRAEAQMARVEATRLSARSTAVQLYAAYREAEARAAAGDRAVAALEASLALAGTRERAGLTSGLDAATARSALFAARARPIAARQASREARLGLEALIGLLPGALEASLGQSSPDSVASPQVRALAAPASVLSRRPDLRVAELELWASGADARAARRDFWPTLSLSAALGGQELSPSTPFTTSGILGQMAGGLTGPLFSFGRLEAARDATDARQVQAQIAYRQAAIDALSEVERALAALVSANARAATLLQATVAAEDQVALATHRYRAGISPYIDVLAARRAAADAEAERAAAVGEALAAYARLNAAAGLGGKGPPATEVGGR